MKHHHITYRNVPRETFDKVEKLTKKSRDALENYLDILLWWNKKINLVSRDVPRETVWDHIRHSLLITFLDCYKSSKTIVDAGTGGGLPGLPLALVSPEKKFVLNDIVTKKAMAVKQMIRKLSLQNVTVFDKSIEKIEVEDAFLLISKHAFKVDDLYKMTREKPWTKMVFYKGLDFERELKGIETPLFITVFDLYKESGHTFYKDKALVEVSR